MRILLLLPITVLLQGIACVQADITEEIPESGVDAGLAVHIGSTDGKLEIDLAKSGRLLIHGLSAKPANVEKARKAISEAGRYGLASVLQVGSFRRLPYSDELANLVIADFDSMGDTEPPTEDELRRVVAPLGSLLIRRDGKWSNWRKPLSDEVDEWHHWDHGADGNPFSSDRRVGPTTSLRWLAGATSIDPGGSKVGLRLSDGRVYYTGLGYDVDGRSRNDNRNDVFSRNAFNGILEWKHPIDGVPGGGDTPPRFALTAKNGKVYCYPQDGGKLKALDAETGEVLVEFDGGPSGPPLNGWDKWKDLVSKIHFIVRVFDGKVMQTYRSEIAVSDESSGKLKWKRDVGEKSVIGWAVAAEGQIFLAVSDKPLVKNRASPITPVSRILALNAENGEINWTFDELEDHALFRMIHHRGSIVIPAFPQGGKSNFASNPTMVRLDAKDGSVIWRKDVKAGTRGHYPIIMARENEIFVGQQGGFGMDFDTGELTETYSWGQVDNSCADLKCVPGFTMYGLTFIDKEGNRIHRGQTRSICDVGLFPAYGMLFGSPLGCLCSEYINGYSALSSKPLEAPVADSLRLEKGEAYGAMKAVKARLGSGWPMHLANPRRGATSNAKLPIELNDQWGHNTLSDDGENPIGPIATDWNDDEKTIGHISSPTVSAGKVFFTRPAAHQVVALDLESGKLDWDYTAGARVDSPPTIIGEGEGALCIFGSRDGYVYCLRVSDGSLVWRFLAARNHRLICVQSQLESAWPVFGSVMFDDGGVVVSAGRQSAIDGGIAIYKLNPADGSIIWKSELWRDPDAELDPDLIRSKIRNQRVNDLLVHNGTSPCLWITPLKNHYDAGESIDIDTDVFSARAMKWSVPTKDDLKELSEATWIWSATSAGLLSRRTTGVGRHDEKGVNYAQLNASKICVSEDGKVLYALDGHMGKSEGFRGGLVRAKLGDGGMLPDKPTWSVKAPPSGNRDAMIVAGDKLYIATSRWNSESTLYCYSADDGSLLSQRLLNARVVRDGLAAADGRLIVSDIEGNVYCLGD